MHRSLSRPLRIVAVGFVALIGLAAAADALVTTDSAGIASLPDGTLNHVSRPAADATLAIPLSGDPLWIASPVAMEDCAPGACAIVFGGSSSVVYYVH